MTMITANAYFGKSVDYHGYDFLITLLKLISVKSYLFELIMASNEKVVSTCLIRMQAY
jgi:hypothetical protein